MPKTKKPKTCCIRCHADKSNPQWHIMELRIDGGILLRQEAICTKCVVAVTSGMSFDLMDAMTHIEALGDEPESD